MRLRVPSESTAGRTASTAPLSPVSTRILKWDWATKPAVTDPDAVARALARLASGAARHRERDTDDTDSRSVVADAEAAMERVSTAAAFVDAGREAELRRAVEDADGRGDDALATRGRAVLSTLEAFRDAAGQERE